MGLWVGVGEGSETLLEGRGRNAQHEAPHAWTNGREVVCRLGADAVPL